MKNWYAVFCKPHKDFIAQEHLQRQGYDIFLPRIQQRKRQRNQYRIVTESMFPRYLFARLDDCDENWAPIRSTVGVSGLVRMGSHVPVVPDTIIAELLRRCDADHCIPLPMEAPLQRNDRVLILDGPLVGMEALFQARNSQDRVIILLNLIEISLPAHSIARAQ